jgi:hypothetical protein
MWLKLKKNAIARQPIVVSGKSGTNYLVKKVSKLVTELF